MIEEGLKMYLEYMDTHPEKKVKDEQFDEWCDYVIQAYQDFCGQLKKSGRL